MKMLGAILITPFVWVVISGVIIAWTDDSNKTGTALLALFIVLAMWGMYFLCGGR